MTTYVAFTPSLHSAPPFQAVVTLDGAQYTLSASWNVTGQRWYLTITDQTNTLIWNGALVGSPLTGNIPLAPNVFQVSTLLYREDTGSFEVSP